MPLTAGRPRQALHARTGPACGTIPVTWSRPPCPPLRPFVELVWAGADAAGDQGGGAFEHVLPTGAMHLVFRLGGTPVQLHGDAAGGAVISLGHAIVGGARSRYYGRQLPTGGCSVGALLRPGAAEPLFDLAASALAERHAPLAALWGAAAGTALDRLAAAPDLASRLDVLESLLIARLHAAPLLHPAVAYALRALAAGRPVAATVARAGYSHRYFAALFERAVGLGPKTWARVQRFQEVLQRLHAAPAAPWSGLALDAGYGDSAHFSRDFAAIAGLTPTGYRAAAPVARNHVTVPELRSISDKRADRQSAIVAAPCRGAGHDRA